MRNSSSENITLEPHEIKKGSTPSPAGTYKTVSAIFDATLVEGLTTRERKIYVNQVREGTHWESAITHPPLSPTEPIAFSNEDVCGVFFPHNGAFVISIPIGNYKIARVLINTGSSVNIMYGGMLDQMEDTREAART